MNANLQQFLNVTGFSGMPTSFVALFLLLAIWSLVWKGFALWKAARNNSNYWFIAMLVLNTAGLLEIIYIFYFSKIKKDNTPVVKP